MSNPNNALPEDDLIDVGIDLPVQPTRFNLAEALHLWVELTGVEPKRNGSFTWGQLSVQFLHEEIQEALELDPTEITGRMLLSFIAQNYFEDRQFTVDDLLNKPDEVRTYLDNARKLAGFLRGEEVAGLATDFAERVKQALERYGALTDEVREIVDHSGAHGDRGMLAVLRRDAMRTLDKLQVHQFLDGDTEAPGTPPAYGKFLYRWDNINSMLRAMVGAPSGVTVNMIQASDKPFGVHFVFAIRNGGRLFVFTDKEQTPHPLAEGMWHAPDKILAKRANRNWFPYDLAGLKFNEEGKAYIETARGTSLVQYQSKAIPVKALAEISAPQVIWLSMMLDLIVEKFWRNEYKAPALSYTGEMTRVATPLLEAAQAANLPVVINEQALLSVQPITLADVHSDAVNPEDVGDMPDQRNRWLEDRYRDRVMETSVDLVSDSADQLLVSYSGADGPKMVKKSSLANVWFSERDRMLARMPEVDVLDPTSFGTKEQIEQERRFLARSNYANQIHALATQEYEERHEEVQKWVSERMLANLPNLEFLLVKDGLEVRTEARGESFSDRAYGVRYYPDRSSREFIARQEGEEFKKYASDAFHGHGIVARRDWKSGVPGCFYTGAPSYYQLKLVPETTEQLAYLCGVSIDELPDVLQNWGMFRLSYGNSILSRVDPMLFQVKNPWDQMHFVLTVFVSKRGYVAMKARVAARNDPLPAFSA